MKRLPTYVVSWLLPIVIAFHIPPLQSMQKKITQEEQKKLDALLFKHAIEGKDFATIERDIKNGANINAIDSEGRTPLHRALEHNKSDTADTLAQLGADVNVQDKWGKTPALLALEQGCINEAIGLLYGYEGDVNLADHSKNTPLLFCTKQGYANVVMELIILGADPHAGDPLQIALDNSKVDTLFTLLEFGAAPSNQQLQRMRQLFGFGVAAETLMDSYANECDEKMFWDEKKKGIARQRLRRLAFTGNAKVLSNIYLYAQKHKQLLELEKLCHTMLM